jgi:hypothetical protein
MHYSLVSVPEWAHIFRMTWLVDLTRIGPMVGALALPTAIHTKSLCRYGRKRHRYPTHTTYTYGPSCMRTCAELERLRHHK